MKTIISLILSFIFGAFIGTFAGFNPVTTGTLVSSIGFVSSFLVPQNGIAYGTISLSAVNAALNSYIQVNKAQIWSRVRQGLELDQYCRMVPNVTGKHANISSSQSEILQAFQTQWTPKGGTTFTPLINESFHVKVDHSIENIDVLYSTYLEWMTDEQNSRLNWPFTRWVVEKEIIPKLIEDQNTASCIGTYVAPTAGTAGSAINSMNGILTTITTLVGASTIAPIVTGAITSSNGVAKVETFIKGIDPKYRPNGKKNIILTSNYVVESYKENYRTQWGLRDKDASNNAKLDMFNVELVGINGFGSSQRMVFAPEGNMEKVYGKVGQPNSLESQLDKRVVNLLGDWWVGYGFATAELLFVNDQA